MKSCCTSFFNGVKCNITVINFQTHRVFFIHVSQNDAEGVEITAKTYQTAFSVISLLR